MIDAWSAYLGLEREGRRREALDRLSRVVDELKALGAQERETWIERLCQSVARGDDVPVRMPLFRDVIFPSLLARDRADDADGAYWLAVFSQQIYAARELWAQLDYRMEIDLLERALALDPRRTDARKRLVAALERAFTVCVHEVPSGVLGFGSMNGASVAECSDLLTRLERFERLVHETGDAERLARSIDRWRTLFEAYRDYLTGHDAPSFADHLAQRGIEWRV